MTPMAPNAGSAIQAFYGTTLSALGTVAAVGDATTTLAQNSGCCMMAGAACLVGSGNGATATYTGVIATRLVKDTANGDSGFGYTAMFPDFVLASTVQGSVATFGAPRVAASAWCDPMIVTFSNPGESQDIVSGEGLKGTTKCTYIIRTGTALGATGGPAFSVKGINSILTNNLLFDLHFAEWRNADVSYLPVDSQSPNFLGYYTQQ